MIKKYITTKNVWIFIILLTLITSLIIPILRVISDKPVILGEKPYYDIRIAETVLEDGLKFRDNLVFEGRDYVAKPYHLVLASLFYFFTPENSLIAISLITGLLSVIFFYLILKKLKINIYQRFFTFVVLLLSPAFIFTFGTANEFCISIMLLLLGTYLFLKSDKSFIYSLLVFLIATIFNLLNVIIIIFLFLFLIEIGIPKKREAHIILAFVLILALVYYVPLYFYSGFASKTE